MHQYNLIQNSVSDYIGTIYFASESFDTICSASKSFDTVNSC